MRIKSTLKLNRLMVLGIATVLEGAIDGPSDEYDNDFEPSGAWKFKIPATLGVGKAEFKEFYILS
jgi:hypothetical protein